VYVAGRVLWPFPWVFVASLLAAIAAYGAGALIEASVTRARPSAAPRAAPPAI
jgi:hypothetical protein